MLLTEWNKHVHVHVLIRACQMYTCSTWSWLSSPVVEFTIIINNVP